MSSKVNITDGGSLPSYATLVDSYRGPSSRNNPFSKSVAYDSEIETLLGDTFYHSDTSLCERITVCFKRCFCCCFGEKSAYDDTLTTDSE